MERLVVNAVGRPRKTSFMGREHYVVPMTLVVPGTLAGSRGPYYYPRAELERNPSIWNGMPLVVYHPSKNGESISARDPEILEKSGIGFVFGAKYVPPSKQRGDEGKLVAEGWFDSARALKVDRRVHEALRAGMVMELSTGLFSESVPAPHGSVDNKGRPYEYIARNYQGDHVAILPDQKGACSISDGCGMMVNCAGPCICTPAWDAKGIPVVENEETVWW